MRVRNERKALCFYDAWLSGGGCGCESGGGEAESGGEEAVRMVMSEWCVTRWSISPWTQSLFVLLLLLIRMS